MATKSIRLSDGTDTLLPESAESSGTYCKMADGTLVCYGTLTIPSGSYVATVTLPKPFANTSYKIAVCALESGLTCNISGAKNTGGFTLGRIPNTAASNFDWIAIGRWK